MTIEASRSTSIRRLGFLAAYPGREYRVFERAGENPTAQLILQVAAIRVATDDIVEAASSERLRFDVAFDDAHPDFALLETVGATEAVENLSRSLLNLGYHLLTEASEDPEAPYDLTRGGDGLDSLPDFMTEEELAVVLRRSVPTIQRYRLDAGLPYLAGRPPLIAKSDLLEFLKQFRTVRPVTSQWKKEYRTIVPYGKGVEDTAGKLTMEARAWALKMKMKPVRRRRKAD